MNKIAILQINADMRDIAARPVVKEHQVTFTQIVTGNITAIPLIDA